MFAQSRVEFPNRQPADRQIICGQGPPPPSPMVVERFQQVISQLFQQRIVRMGGAVDDDMANCEAQCCHISHNPAPILLVIVFMIITIAWTSQACLVLSVHM